MHIYPGVAREECTVIRSGSGEMGWVYAVLDVEEEDEDEVKKNKEKRIM